MEDQYENRDEDPQTLAAMRDSFSSLLELNKPSKSNVMERCTYDQYVGALLNDASAPSSPLAHRPKFSNRTRFKILYDGDRPYLARANSNKRLYHREELFWTIFSAHRSCNHGDGKTYGIVKEFADNIHLWECYLVTKLCYCKRVKSKTSTSKTVTSSPKSKAGDLHIINMKNNPDKSYQWILLYKDDMRQNLFS